MTKLIIIGAGGHGRVVADCAEATKAYEEIVFLDDCFPERKVNSKWHIIGRVSDFNLFAKDYVFFVAFGNNALRESIYNQLKLANLSVVSLIHPTAVISNKASISKGTVVLANAVINIDADIQEGVIINTASIIEHDCIIKPFVHVSPNAAVAGGVTIGEKSWLGISCSIVECLIIAPNTKIGAGAAVISNTQENSLYVGVPAKKIKDID